LSVARVFTSGFEVASNTSGHEWTNSAISTATRTTSAARSGSASGRVNGLASATPAGWAVQFAETLNNGPYYLRIYLRVDTAPTADNCVMAATAGANVTSTSVNDGQIRLTSTGTLRLFANNSAVGSASAALTLGTWYRVELEIDNTPASGSKVIRAYLDGVQFAGTSSSSNVGGTMNGVAVGGNLCAETQTVGDWYFDDVAVNDSAGLVQTGLPGDGKVIVIRPDAAGDANQWADTANSAGTTSNFQLVDETNPNDGTDLVQSGTLDDLDLYNFGASGIGASDTVNVVHVHLRRRNNVADATAAVNVVVVKTSGGTQATGTAVVPNSVTWRTGSSTTSTVIAPNYTGYLDPDGAAWSQATLDTMQAGPKLTTAGTNRVQVSTAWATIDYTPAPGGTTHEADSTLTAAGSLAGSATADRDGSASPAATGTLAAVPLLERNAVAPLTGTGALAVGADVTRPATAPLPGTGSLTADAAITAAGTAGLAATGLLAGAAIVSTSVGATFTGAGSLAAAAVAVRDGSTTLTAVGGLTALATVERYATAALTGEGALTGAATGKRIPGVHAPGATRASLAASGTRAALSAGTTRG
jgi:hypothetical protein